MTLSPLPIDNPLGFSKFKTIDLVTLDISLLNMSFEVLSKSSPKSFSILGKGLLINFAAVATPGNT